MHFRFVFHPHYNPKCNYSICLLREAFSFERRKNVQILFETRRRDTRPRITAFHNWGKKRDEDFLIHVLLCRSEDVKKGKHNRTIIKKIGKIKQQQNNPRAGGEDAKQQNSFGRKKEEKRNTRNRRFAVVFYCLQQQNEDERK